MRLPGNGLLFGLTTSAASCVLAVLAACGGYGSGGGMAMPLTIDLAVQPTTITLGQSATLTWTTGNAP